MDAARFLAERDQPGRLRPGGKGCGRSCKPPLTPHTEVVGRGSAGICPDANAFRGVTQPCGFPPFLASRFDSQIASGLLEGRAAVPAVGQGGTPASPHPSLLSLPPSPRLLQPLILFPLKSYMEKGKAARIHGRGLEGKQEP